MFDKEKFVIEKTVLSSSYVPLTSYYDFIKALHDEDFNKSLVGYVHDLLPCNFIGVELFGALISYYLFGIFNNNCYRSIIILKIRKHGARKQIYNEETINKEWKTLLFDDVITTGKTINYAMEILDKNDIKVDRILCIKNRSSINKIKKCKIYEIL